MKIHLDETELKSIIQEYLANQMPELSRRTFEIQFTAGRGGTGHRAEVEIMPADVPESVPATEPEKLSEQPAVTPFNFGDTDEESTDN